MIETAKKQHAGSVEAPINSDAHPTVGLQRGGNKCATGAKTVIRLPKEETNLEDGKSALYMRAEKYRSSLLS